MASSLLQSQPSQQPCDRNAVSDLTQWRLEQIHGIRPTGPRFSELIQVYHGQNEVLKRILSHEGPRPPSADSISDIQFQPCRWHGIVSRNEELLGQVCRDFVGTKRERECRKHHPRTCFSPKVAQSRETVTLQPLQCTMELECFKYLPSNWYLSDFEKNFTQNEH